MTDQHWWVVSPMMEEVEPVLDDGSGPMVQFCDVVSVAASTKRRAIIAGVKAMTAWPAQQRGDDLNPFVGVKADPAMCPHGFCGCDLPDAHLEQDDYCETCDAEHREELAR